MEKVYRIALIGAPDSGKHKLIEALFDFYKKDYHVIIVDEPATKLIQAGMRPPYVYNTDEFQLDLLNEYLCVYCQINGIIENLAHKNLQKPILVIYNTLIQDGQCYYSKKDSTKAWIDKYNIYKTLDSVKDNNPMDLVFLCEYSDEKSHKIGLSFDVNKKLCIEEKLKELHPNAITLNHDWSCDEKVSEISRHLENKINPLVHHIVYTDFSDKLINAIKINNTSCTNMTTIIQHCNFCDWEGKVDINHLFHYCPMCGRLLTYIGTYGSSTGGGVPDPLGVEKSRKMFYVDPDQVPYYKVS